jgi:hypothetical protein
MVLVDGVRTQHPIELLHNLWCVLLDLPALLPSIFVFIVALPLDEVLVLPLMLSLVNNTFDGIKGLIVLVYNQLGRVTSMFRIVVVKLEHIGGENGVAIVFLWNIEGAVSELVYLGDPVWSFPHGVEFVREVLLPGTSLVHDIVPNVEALVSITSILGVPSLFDSSGGNLVMGYLVVKVHVLEVLVIIIIIIFHFTHAAYKAMA